MKRPLYLLLALALIIPAAAQAHRPVEDDGTHTSPENAIALEDFELSQVTYHEVSATSNQLWFRFDAAPGQLLYWQAGVPQLDRLDGYRPTVVLLGPGLPGLGEVPFDVPEDLGGIIFDSGGETAETFFEPFTATSSWIVQQVERNVTSEGTYYLMAYHPEGTPGKFWIAIGKREEFGLDDILDYADTVAAVRAFHEDSSAPYSLLNWGLLTLSYLTQIIVGPFLFLFSLLGF